MTRLIIKEVESCEVCEYKKLSPPHKRKLLPGFIHECANSSDRPINSRDLEGFPAWCPLGEK